MRHADVLEWLWWVEMRCGSPAADLCIRPWDLSSWSDEQTVIHHVHAPHMRRLLGRHLKGALRRDLHGDKDAFEIAFMVGWAWPGSACGSPMLP